MDRTQDTTIPEHHAARARTHPAWFILLAGFFIACFAFSRIPYHAYTIKPAMICLFVMLAGCVWILKGLKTGQLDVAYRNSVFLPALCLLGAQVLALTQCTNIYAGLLAVGGEAVLFAMFVIAASTSPRRGIRHLAWMMTLSGLLTSLYALYQVLARDPIYGEHIHDPFATFGNSNFAANFLVVAIPMTALAWWHTKNRWLRILCTAAILLEIYFLVRTKSRGGWIAVSTGCMVAFFSMMRHTGFRNFLRTRRFLYSAAFLVLAGISLLLTTTTATTRHSIFDEAVSTFDLDHPTIRFRILAWKSSLKLAWESFPLGVGPGNFSVVYPTVASPQEHEILGSDTSTAHAHNDYLQVFAETGLPGILAMLWLIAALLSFLWKHAAPNEKCDHAHHAVLAAVVGFCMHAVFSFPFHLPFGGLIFLLLAGTATAHDSTEVSCIRIHRGFLKVVVGAGVLALAIAGCWTHYRHLISTYHLGLAENQFKARALAQSREHLDKAQAYHWRNPVVYFYRGLIEGREGNLDASIEALEACYGLRPYSSRSLSNLANAYRLRNQPGDIERALEMLDRAVKLRHDSDKVYQLFGHCYEQKGQFRGAEAAFRKAIEQDPKDVDALEALGNFYERHNEPKKAQEVYLKLVDLKPKDARILSNLARFYLRCGALDECQEAVNTLLACAPQHDQGLLWQGLLYEKRGNMKEAVSYYRKALRLNPASKGARIRLALALQAKDAPVVENEGIFIPRGTDPGMLKDLQVWKELAPDR